MTCAAKDLSKVQAQAREWNIALAVVGEVGGQSIAVSGLLDLPLGELSAAHGRWLPEYMSGPDAQG